MGTSVTGLACAALGSGFYGAPEPYVAQFTPEHTLKELLNWNYGET